jgi:hypothetical protein
MTPTPAITALIDRFAAKGLSFRLRPDGQPAVVGGRIPSDLRPELTRHRAALIEHLTGDPPADSPAAEGCRERRYHQVPPTGASIVYRSSPPPSGDWRQVISYILHQHARVRDWCQVRAGKYFERDAGWPHAAYDHAAALDLIKWQRGAEQLPELSDAEPSETTNKFKPE